MTKEMVAVIFACRHEKEYAGRIETALKWVLDNNINPIFVFTGNDPVPLNRIFTLFDNKRIIWEKKSIDTQSNVENTLKALKDNWIDHLPRVWASSWYQIPRIKLLLKKAGNNVSRETFIKSYSSIALINVLVEPLAYIADYFDFGHWPIITYIKRGLGYNV